MTEPARKKFVPKRRAPYLLQDEIIRQSNNVAVNQDYNNEVKESINTALNNKPKPKPKAKEVTENKTGSDKFDVIFKLYGIQKKIVVFFVKSCIRRQSTETGAITLESLCDVSGTTKKTLKKTIQRLIEKNIIKRVGGKRGKGGFSIFSLEQEIINIAKIKLDMEQDTVIKSDSNNFISVGNVYELPEEWKNINFESIESIGFNIAHIRQLYNSKVTTAEAVKKSIEQFAFALENKRDKLKKYKSELAALMSTLTRGGVWTEPDYESPQDRALRLVVEQEKMAQERRKKLEDDLIGIEFEKWRLKLTEIELEDLIPDSIKNANVAKDRQVRGFLREHFIKNYWDTIKQEKHGDCFS